jgi:hypothetical protein
MRIDSDIDIDFGDRERLLKLIPHTRAAMRNNTLRHHATGIYVTDIPYDPVNDMATMDYMIAEKRGYFKLDLLNVYIYQQVRNEQHLVELMTTAPDWSMLKDYNRMKSLIHLQNHYQNIKKMPEPIDSIPRLAMFLALIRPAKKHLIGKTWKEVSQTIWDKEADGYSFKKSHAIAYAHLVVVHMNLLTQSVSQV